MEVASFFVLCERSRLQVSRLAINSKGRQVAFAQLKHLDMDPARSTRQSHAK